MDPRTRKSVVLGLVLPAIGVLVILPLLANTTIHVFGMPLLFVWIFLMFPFTSLCLWLAWRIDEPYYREEPEHPSEGNR